jgi:nucleoside-diphosphate-sugar epimerase
VHGDFVCEGDRTRTAAALEVGLRRRDQTRDFTYTEDVVEAFVLASQAPAAAGEVINVSAGQQTTVLGLLATLFDLIAADTEPIFEPARAGEVLASHGDRGKAAALLDWEPRWSLRDALGESIAGVASSLSG